MCLLCPWQWCAALTIDKTHLAAHARERDVGDARVDARCRRAMRSDSRGAGPASGRGARAQPVAGTPVRAASFRPARAHSTRCSSAAQGAQPSVGVAVQGAGKASAHTRLSSNGSTWNIAGCCRRLGVMGQNRAPSRKKFLLVSAPSLSTRYRRRAPRSTHHRWRHDSPARKRGWPRMAWALAHHDATGTGGSPTSPVRKRVRGLWADTVGAKWENPGLPAGAGCRLAPPHRAGPVRTAGPRRGLPHAPHRDF